MRPRPSPKDKRILLDVGNTSVTYGVYQGGKLRRFGSELCADIPKIVKIYASGGRNSPFHMVMGSVVPKNTRFLKKKVAKTKGLRVWEVGRDLPVKLPSRYKRHQLGIDRLVNLYGAWKLYGCPILVIDYGTAITFDYVSSKGRFEGGMIIPGPEISFQALLDRAALIPKGLRLPNKSIKFLGKNTYDCMKSGILQGFGALTEGMIQKFRRRYGRNLKVVSTGGFAGHLRPHIHIKHKYDPQLSIKSLNALFLDSI